MAAGVVQIPWYATLFRGDQFAAALEEIAPVATRYGATDYRVFRNRDDMYKFTQLSDVRDKVEFEAYWYGPEMTSCRAVHSCWYQVPILYTWNDLIYARRPQRTSRPCPRAAAPSDRSSRRTSCASGPAPCGAGPAAWPGSSRRVRAQRLADALLHRGDEARLVVSQPRARPGRAGPRARGRVGRPRPRVAEVCHAEPGGLPRAQIVAIEPFQAATSMSGGGVGATVKSCGGISAADVADERPAGRLVQVAT